ncbi:MAG: spherulation-specific family 4 protein [Nitrososphaerota archaeon]|nr:spherulation-specific family 4 protein [Nitrososphaerota archaeon]
MREHSTLKFTAIAAAILLFISPIAISSMSGYFSKSNAQTQTGTMGIVIPLYTYPGSTWTEVIQAKNAYPSVPFVVVINPNSGPGTSQDSNYAQGIQNLQAAGIKVLGYVDTAYAGDSISSVEANVNLYNTWYHVNGIMFDDMSNLATDQSYYATLNTYVKSLGMTLTMGNPGATVPTSEVGVFNILDIYESSGLPSLSSLLYSGYPTSDFSMVAFGVPSISTSFLSSASSYVGYIYLTDAGLPNPYGVLPSYFTSLVADLAALDPSTSTTTTTTSSTVSVNVNSADLSGNQISGMWTTVSSNGATTQTGYTPVSFSAAVGNSYTVCVSNYGNYVFDHWSDGTTNSCDTITPNQSTSMEAYYSTGSASLTVQSEDLSGSTMSGLWTTISSNGVSVDSGYTTISYTGNVGQTYTVCVSNYGSYTFNHWSDGSTNSCDTVTLSSSTSLTAYYSTPVTLTIQSDNLAGTPITGMWTTVSSNGVVVASGNTPFSFTGISGVTYTISSSNYGSYTFNHWSDGSTGNSITLTPTQSTTLTAYYSSQVTITIESANLNGNQFSGMWTVFSSSGNIVATGYTPMTITVNSGTQYAISVSNYGRYVFSYWSNGQTTSSITITPTQNIVLVAYYKT